MGREPLNIQVLVQQEINGSRAQYGNIPGEFTRQDEEPWQDSVKEEKEGMQRLSKIAQPLHALTKQGVKFVWGEECSQNFNTPDLHSMAPDQWPITDSPSFKQTFILRTVASILGLGAVLS